MFNHGFMVLGLSCFSGFRFEGLASLQSGCQLKSKRFSASLITLRASAPSPKP